MSHSAPLVPKADLFSRASRSHANTGLCWRRFRSGGVPKFDPGGVPRPAPKRRPGGPKRPPGGPRRVPEALLGRKVSFLYLSASVSLALSPLFRLSFSLSPFLCLPCSVSLSLAPLLYLSFSLSLFRCLPCAVSLALSRSLSLLSLSLSLFRCLPFANRLFTISLVFPPVSRSLFLSFAISHSTPLVPKADLFSRASRSHANTGLCWRRFRLQDGPRRLPDASGLP